jgi:hypothetical protein
MTWGGGKKTITVITNSVQFNFLIIYMVTQQPRGQLESKQREKQNKHIHTKDKTRQCVSFRQ